MLYKIFYIIFFLILGGCNMDDTIKQINLEDFFRNPEYSSFQLSPNGEIYLT